MASGSRSSTESQFLWHNPQSSDVIWSPEEQYILEKLLIIYASEPNLAKYSKIAEYLNGKTVRDVAFRIKWTTGTKRPIDDVQLNFVQPSISCYPFNVDFEAVGKLVEENNRAYDRITSNFCSLQIDENFYLLSQARSNIFMIFDHMHENMDLMKHMPPIDVKLNNDLANFFLPRERLAGEENRGDMKKKTTTTRFIAFLNVSLAVILLIISSSSPAISQTVNITCTSNLIITGILFDTTSLTCTPVWSSQNFTLRYKKAGTNLWSFVLTAPNKNAYVGIGFSPNGKMTGSSAMVGWVTNSGDSVIKQYLLTGKSPAEVVPDVGNLNLAENTSSIVSLGSDIYLAFQVRTAQPWNRIIYSVGMTGRLPSSSNFRLAEHADMISTNLDYATGQQTETKNNKYGNLRRSHGILNMLGWGILLPIGAIAARFFKKWDPLWYYSHVIIQTTGFILGVVGIICGFILKNKLGVHVTRHRGIGITVLVLGCLQVVAFMARPDKGSKYRKYWNWYHYAVGRFVIMLAAINVFYGISLGKAGSEWNVAYAIILVALFVTTILLEIRMWMKK